MDFFAFWGIFSVVYSPNLVAHAEFLAEPPLPTIIAGIPWHLIQYTSPGRAVTMNRNMYKLRW